MPWRRPGDGERSSERAVESSRRRFLTLLGSGAVGAGALRVLYELVGYGTVSGTNITEQDVGSLVRESLDPSAFKRAYGDRTLAFDGERVHLRDGAGATLTTVPVFEVDPKTAATQGAAYDLGRPLGRLATDLTALSDGAVTVDVSGYEAFFERVRSAESRPLAVAALRGDVRQQKPAAIRAFADSDPADPEALVTGLAKGFGDNTHFDTTRYVVGNLQEHVLRDAVTLRSHLEGPRDFTRIRDGVGFYCWEYAVRSVEAFHAIAPHRQTTPVFGAFVHDRRHNHMYTALGSVVREEGNLHLPMTLLDYSHATMYDNTGLRVALGPGIDAYDSRHRASAISF